MPLSPWQRMMAERARQRRTVAHEIAARRMLVNATYLAREIANPPPIRVENPGDPRAAVLDNTGISFFYDSEMTPDQYYWEAEAEIEKWDDFVKELRKPSRKKEKE